MLNIKSNPLKKAKKIEYSVNIENQKPLKERIAKPEEHFVIKDDEKNKNLFFDTIIDGKRHKTMARYTKYSKTKSIRKDK